MEQVNTNMLLQVLVYHDMQYAQQGHDPTAGNAPLVILIIAGNARLITRKALITLITLISQFPLCYHLFC